MIENPQTEWMLEQLQQSPFATGFDASHWKGELSFDGVDMVRFAEVNDFMILRVGYGAEDGTVVEDRKFKENYAKCFAFDVPVLGYWYLSSHSDYRRQTDKYLQIVEGLPLMGHVSDYEHQHNVMDAAFARIHGNFLRVMDNEFPNTRKFTYCGPDNYDQITKTELEPHKHAYWLARWPWHNWVDWAKWPEATREEFKRYWSTELQTLAYGPSALPNSRPSWDLWQFVGNGSGIGHELGFQSDELDFNISRLTKEAFYAWLDFQEEEEEEPTDPPIIIDPPDETDEEFDVDIDELVASIDNLTISFSEKMEELSIVFQSIAISLMKMSGMFDPGDEGGDEDEDEDDINPPDPGDGGEPEVGWENWWNREDPMTWPAVVDNDQVGYAFVEPGTPLQMLIEKDGTFEPYESVKLRGLENTKGKRIIINQPNPPLMVFARGNQYRNVIDKDVRPFNAWADEKGNQIAFDGGSQGYLVMPWQIKDGIRLWDGLPNENVILWMPARYVTKIYNPRTNQTLKKG